MVERRARAAPPLQFGSTWRRSIRRDEDIASCLAVVLECAAAVGLCSVTSGMVATATVELATNVLKYAKRGNLVVTQITGDSPGVCIVVSDAGPGIDDVEAALQDNVSSSGTLGLGLPGAKRLMDQMSIETSPDSGTTVTAYKWL